MSAFKITHIQSADSIPHSSHQYYGLTGLSVKLIEIEISEEGVTFHKSKSPLAYHSTDHFGSVKSELRGLHNTMAKVRGSGLVPRIYEQYREGVRLLAQVRPLMPFMSLGADNGIELLSAIPLEIYRAGSHDSTEHMMRMRHLSDSLAFSGLTDPDMTPYPMIEMPYKSSTMRQLPVNHTEAHQMMLSVFTGRLGLAGVLVVPQFGAWQRGVPGMMIYTPEHDKQDAEYEL